MSYASVYAFCPDDLMEMDKHYDVLKSMMLAIEEAEEEEDDVVEAVEEARDQLSILESIIREYRSTWYIIDNLMTEQEREMLREAFINKHPDAEQAVKKAKQAVKSAKDMREEMPTWNEWKQVGGDYQAHVEGATFCRADKYGYEFVQVINMQASSGEEGPYPDGVYWTEEHYVDRSDLDSEQAEDAKRSWGRCNEEWTNLDVAIAMQEYGGHTSGYPRSFKTLAEAMDEFYIPQDALWSKEEYNAVWEEE